MTTKGFAVKIYFDLNVVTCPGVWLCPNGNLALRINTLNSHIETIKVSPGFPLTFDEKFLFKKTFIEICTLTQLQCCLEEEYFYAELIQWPTIGCKGVILATFETNLVDLLYPAPCLKGLAAGIEVDLLMEPTKDFPGILAPKLEVSTRTVIEEVGVYQLDVAGAHIINPKLINSKGRPCLHRKRPPEGILRQRNVCHSQGKPRNRCAHQHCSYAGELQTPSASDRKSDQSHVDQCYQGSSKHQIMSYRTKCCQRALDNVSTSHNLDHCPVCSRYRSYFSKDSHSRETLTVRSGDENRRVATYGICDVKNCGDHSSLMAKSSSRTLQEKIRILQQYLK